MACARACEQAGPLAVIDIRDVYTLLGRWVDVMKDIGSRAAFEQNAAPEIALNRAAQNIFSPSASQREQQEAAAAQGLGGGVGALGGSAENAIVAILKESLVATKESMARAEKNSQQLMKQSHDDSQKIMIAMGGMSSRLGTVEDKVDAVDGRVDAMDGKVEDVRREATEKANAMDGKVEDVRRQATEKANATAEKVVAVEGRFGEVSATDTAADTQSEAAEMQAARETGRPPRAPPPHPWRPRKTPRRAHDEGAGQDDLRH